MKVEYIDGIYIYGRLDNYPVNSVLKYGVLIELPYYLVLDAIDYFFMFYYIFI
jgi:hypothetical protein